MPRRQRRRAARAGSQRAGRDDARAHSRGADDGIDGGQCDRHVRRAETRARRAAVRPAARQLRVGAGVGDEEPVPAKPAFNPGDGAALVRLGQRPDELAHRRPLKDAGLRAAQVPSLQLKWAFGFPNGSSAYGQPAVAGGRVFVGSDNGFVYSLDAATGCVYWSFEAKAGVRTAISLGTIKTATGTRHAAYFGDLRPTCLRSTPRPAR